jgi:acetate kinase
MGTRCGDIDPALVFYIGRATGMDPATVEALLNKESGLKGLCGANDMREVLKRMDAGDAPARLAFEVYCYRIRKYIGAYCAVLGRVDAIVFTAGVGENAPAVRAQVCADLTALGVRLDANRNAAVRGAASETASAITPTTGRTSEANRASVSPRGPRLDPIGEIHSADSAVKLLVVRTNEELEIAEQTRAVLTTGP